MKSTNDTNTTTFSTPDNSSQGAKKSINPELWQACAGPLVNLPAGGTHVVYFPQGHSEQVAASMKRDIDAQIPSYPNLPSKLLCLLHSVTLHADPETDEVYAQMTLQPVPSCDNEALFRSDLSLRAHKPQTEFFCKTLTASDTSTHGGFSVPRRAAEKSFPPLDFSMQPPAQELVARDLHDNVWTFRHIYRGQPKRHLLTTGWSLFISGKKLFAGDSVLFVRDEKQQLLLGLRRANRQPTNLSSSVLSSDSMHIGILAAAAHAAANNSPFTVFYNPRTSPSEFVIPLAKYYKAMNGQQISLGMRFRMMFETEESGTRRYMGTVTGISDLDPLRWKNSQWRNLQVGWDESTAGEKHSRVSVWEIEPVTAPFFICPPPFLGAKRPRLPGMPDDDSDLDNLFNRTMPWLGDDPHGGSGLSLMQWMNIQQNTTLGNPMQSNILNTLPGSQQNNLQFNSARPVHSVQQLDQRQNSQGGLNPLSSLMMQSQPPFSDVSQQPRQNLIDQTLPSTQVQSLAQNPNSQQQPTFSLHNHQLQGNISNILLQQNQQPSLQVTDNPIQLQILQRLQQQQQSLLSQQHTGNQFQDMTQTFSRSLPPSQIHPQPINQCNSQMNVQFCQPSAVPKLQQQQPVIMPEIPTSNNLSILGGGNLAGGVAVGQSALTDEIPSCSTSPSTNNGPINGFGTVLSNANSVKELHQKADVKPSINVSKMQNQGRLNQQTFRSIPSSQLDYLDTSSATSASFSQNDIVSQTDPLPNSQSILFGDAGHNVELQANLRNDVATRVNIEGLPGILPLVSNMPTKKMSVSDRNVTNNVTSGCLVSNYESTKDELSSSMVTQSFGVPDMAFNSIDSAISDNSFVNRGTWAQPPQYQRMRTYTKVYKRGAVGRSIDITRYSGYEELKQDLVRMFGIEGQMEDRGRAGWKLVYVDHENDVLLVGDDPWEDFVNCVRCVKILSPQEVQQMSLDGDFGNASLPNQACSSSDGGNV